jgi:hypothetical protein
MARKKPKAPEPPRKKNLVVIRGFEDWGKWLEGYAGSKGMPVVVLIDHLLREAAREDGYPAPPKRY